MATENRLEVQLGANIQALTDGLGQATGVVRSAADQMGRMFDGLGRSVGNLAAPFLALTGLIGGGAMFKGAVDATVDFSKKIFDLSRDLGIDTQAASGLAVALDNVDVTTDVYTNAIFKLQRSLRTQEQELNRNQVATRTAGGAMLGVDEIMTNVLTRLQTMKAGYDANALAMLAFGRGAAEVQPLLRLTAEKLAEGAVEARKLGLELGPDRIAAMFTYRRAVNEIGDALLAMKVAIGNELLPHLTSLANTLASVIPAAIGPLVGALRAGVELLSMWTVRVGLLAAALYGPLRSVLLSTTNALVGFVQGIRVQMALAQMPVVALGEEWKLQLGRMGASAATGMGSIRAFGAAVLGAVNPITAAVVGIGGLAFGLERLSTHASRAAEKSLELSRAMLALQHSYANLLTEGDRYNQILKDGAKSEDDKKRAQEDLLLVVRRLSDVYPDFLKYLYDEAGQQRNIGEAMQLARAAQIALTETKIAELRATIQKKESLIKEAESAEAAARSMGKFGVVQQAAYLSSIGMSWGIKDQTTALTSYRKELDDAYEALKHLQGQSAPKPAETFARPSAEILQAFRTELESRKLAESNWFTWSQASELAFWRSKIETFKSGTVEYLDVAREINRLRKEIAVKAVEEQVASMKAEQESLAGHPEQQLVIQQKITALMSATYKERSTQAQGSIKEETRLEKEGANMRLGAVIEGLSAEQDAARYDGELRLSIQREKTAQLLTRYDLESKEVGASLREETRIVRENRDEQARLMTQVIEAERAYQSVTLDQRMAHLSAMKDLGLLSERQALEIEQRTENERYAIDQAALESELANGEKSLEQKQEILLRESALLQAHEGKLVEFADRARAIFAGGFETMFQGMHQSLQSALDGMMAGSVSFAEGMKNIWSGLVASLRQMIAQMIADWLVKETKNFVVTQVFALKNVLLHKATAAENAVAETPEVLAKKAAIATMTAAAVAGDAAQSAAAAEASLLSIAMSRAAAMVQIPAAAGIAAVNAMASVAAIPVYGWAMAPAVGAETFATGMGYLGLAAAAEGYDVPAGLNPITRLHEREMVLPAPLAERVREMTAPTPSETLNIHYAPRVEALDMEGVGRVLDRHSSVFIRRLNEWHRNGRTRR